MEDYKSLLWNILKILCYILFSQLKFFCCGALITQLGLVNMVLQNWNQSFNLIFESHTVKYIILILN